MRSVYSVILAVKELADRGVQCRTLDFGGQDDVVLIEHLRLQHRGIDPQVASGLRARLRLACTSVESSVISGWPASTLSPSRTWMALDDPAFQMLDRLVLAVGGDVTRRHDGAGDRRGGGPDEKAAEADAREQQRHQHRNQQRRPDAARPMLAIAL